MNPRVRSSLVAAFLSFGALSAEAALGEEPKTKRDEAVAAVDENRDQRLDKKEMKNLKKGHPLMYDSLRDFCEDAVDHPKRNGVELPPNPSKDDLQCKKKHVAAAYLTAWAAEGKQLGPNPEDKVHQDRVTEEGGHAIP
jgi:hypothetical protein